MPGQPLLIPLGVLVVVILVIGAVRRSVRVERERRRAIAASLGFTPVEPTPEFGARINRLYESIRVDPSASKGGRYRLRNVYGRHQDEAELFIFDLTDASDGGDRMERQAVLVASQRLDLPPFVIFPHPGVEGVLAKLGNRLIEWMISRFGEPVEFPDAPDFTRRYLVSSPDPESTRAFLHGDRLGRLAETRLLSVHAAGGMFAVSRMDQTTKTVTLELMRDRVDAALALFKAFRT